MAATIGGLIQDPDSLSYEIGNVNAVTTTTKEVVIDTGNLLIKLTRVGNLTADGVTLQCLYSFMKEKWSTDQQLLRLGFPFSPITNEQFDMINGWNFDANVNPTTKSTVANANVTIGFSTVTIPTGNSIDFANANVYIGQYISATGIAANTRVTAINSNIQVTLSNSAISTNKPITISFYGDIDYTYNLIRNGAWSVRANISADSTEEWMGVVSLGSLGGEGLTYTTTANANITNSNVLTISDVTTNVVGSFVTGANIPQGTVITAITSNTQFTISKTIGSIKSGAVITIRPKDQPYYQLGANANAAPTQTTLTGQINQPVKIYGDATHGNFDYRPVGNVFNVYAREQGYTYSQSSKSDIGFANLTYQVYRFPLVSLTDTYISASDATISSNGVTPTGSPYNNMRITWYATPQARVINGATYYFNVIIDANTAATSTYSTATAQQVYEFVQWTLRRPYTVDIDSGPLGKNGSTTRALLTYAGSQLQTIYDSSDGGVYIDHFRVLDINSIGFTDNNRTLRTYSFIAQGTLTFNSYLASDGANATYSLYYNQINQGNVISAGYSISGSRSFGTRNAVLVKGFSIDTSGDGTLEIRGNLTGSVTSVAFDYPYEYNTQTTWLANNRYYVGDEYSYSTGTTAITTVWYRVTTAYTSGASFNNGVDAVNSTVILGPTVVLAAIGRTNGQAFNITGTLYRSSTNLVSAIPQQEKNYATS